MGTFCHIMDERKYENYDKREEKNFLSESERSEVGHGWSSRGW